MPAFSMRVDFQSPKRWQETNEDIEHQLFGSADGRLKSFWGLDQALLENLLSAKSQFPLKKKVFFFRGLDPSIDLAMKYLAREGLSLQPLDVAQFTGGDWGERVDKDALAVIFPLDDPFWGELFDVHSLNGLLADKRVLRIQVSHLKHLVHGLPKIENPFEIHLLSLDSDLCIGLFGERARIPSFFAETLPWGEQRKNRILATIAKRPVEAKALVQQFEAKRLGGCEPYFSNVSQRLFDRAVVYWTDMDGYAFIEQLCEDLQLPLSLPGQEGYLETPSLSRWGGVATMDWLTQRGHSLERIRGCVIISAELLRRPDFEERFLKAREAILALQS